MSVKKRHAAALFMYVMYLIFTFFHDKGEFHDYGQ